MSYVPIALKPSYKKQTFLSTTGAMVPMFLQPCPTISTIILSLFVPSEGAECGRYSLPRAIHLAFIVSVLYSTFLVALFFLLKTTEEKDNLKKIKLKQLKKVKTTSKE